MRARSHGPGATGPADCTKFDADPAFAERSRKRVVLLQAGDEATLALWRRLIDVSVEHFTAASLAVLASNARDAVLAVDTVDTVYGTICRHGTHEVRIAVQEITIARAAAGRNAFSSPFTSGPGGGY